MANADRQFKINQVTDKKQWDDFVSASPQGSIFSLSFYLESLGPSYICYLIFLKNKAVAGVCVLLDDSEQPIKAPYNFSPYHGIMFAPSAGDNHTKIKLEFEISEFIIDKLLALYNKISFCHSYNYKDLRPFQWHNYHKPERGVFTIDLRYTGVLDITHFDFNVYLEQIRKSRRQEYQYATARHNLLLKESDDVELLDYLHGLTFERQGIQRSAGESALVKNISRACLDKKSARLAVVYDKKTAVAANLFIFDEHGGYYLFGANHPDFRDTGASAYLLLEQIKYTAERGLKKIDFLGVNSPNRGDYKLSFNPDLMPYFEVFFGF